MGLQTHLMLGVENSEEKKAQHEICVVGLEINGSRQEQRTEDKVDGRKNKEHEAEMDRAFQIVVEHMEKLPIDFERSIGIIGKKSMIIKNRVNILGKTICSMRKDL